MVKFNFKSVYKNDEFIQMARLNEIYSYMTGLQSAKKYLYKNEFMDGGDFVPFDNKHFLSLSSGIVYAFLDDSERVAVVDMVDKNKLVKDKIYDAFYDYDIVLSSFSLEIGFNDDGTAIHLFVEY